MTENEPKKELSKFIPIYQYTDFIFSKQYECTVESFQNGKKFWWEITIPNHGMKPYEWTAKIGSIEHELIVGKSGFQQEKFFALVLDGLFYHKEKVIQCHHFFATGCRFGDLDTLQRKITEKMVRKKPKSNKDQFILKLLVQKAEFFIIMDLISPDDRTKLRFQPQHLVRIERLETKYVPQLQQKFLDQEKRFSDFQKLVKRDQKKLILAVDTLINERFAKIVERLREVEEDNKQMREDNERMQQRLLEVERENENLHHDLQLQRYKFHQNVSRVKENTEEQLKKVSKFVVFKVDKNCKKQIASSSKSNSSRSPDVKKHTSKSQKRKTQTPTFSPAPEYPGLDQNLSDDKPDTGYKYVPKSHLSDRDFTFTWNPKVKHPKLVISSNWLILRSMCNETQSCLGNLVFDPKLSGVYEWDISCQECQNDGNATLYVGVCDPNFEVNSRCGFTPRSWSLNTRSGKICHNSQMMQYLPSNYKFKYRSNDTISIILDLREKTLSFCLNGNLLGVAWQNVHPPLCPVVTFERAGTVIELSL